MNLAGQHEWQREVRKSRHLHCHAHAAQCLGVGGAHRRPDQFSRALYGDGSGITQIYEGTDQIQRIVMARQLTPWPPGSGPRTALVVRGAGAGTPRPGVKGYGDP